MKKLSTLLWENGSKILPDETVLRILFRKILGQRLNLDNPQTFNEKLQWLKLYYREPLFTAMVDKYGVKQYVASIIGEKYLAKTYGVYEDFDDIDFDALPDSFVMKCTHDSGGLVIVKDKSKLDKDSARLKLQRGLKKNYFYPGREWPYKNVPPRILIEEFLHDDANEVLPVYKFFNFNNGDTIIQAISNDKTPDESIDYFDTNWDVLNLKQIYKNSATPPSKPANFDEMLSLAKKLSKGFPFLRTDFYSVGGVTYFSEFTFYSDSGFGKFEPDSWDKELGSRIQLPKLHTRRNTMNAKLNHLIACIKHPIKAVKYIAERGGGYRMSDREYLEFAYEYIRGERINIDAPTTYTEKLNWMKVYDHNPLYTKLADKYSVKKCVEDKIGKDYIIPLIGVWNAPEEIDFQALPDKFVLKCTHDSGGVFICEDKEKFDVDEVKAKIKQRLQRDYSQSGREWSYHDIPRRIIAEKYVEDLSDNNYKFFCFDGKCKALYVAPYREKFVDYFDRDFNHLDIFTEIHGMDIKTPEKPDCFEKMRDLAETLAAGLRAVRVDLYLSHGKIYFGEFTFFHEGGFMPFQPDHWNYDFGSWIKID